MKNFVYLAIVFLVFTAAKQDTKTSVKAAAPSQTAVATTTAAQKTAPAATAANSALTGIPNASPEMMAALSNPAFVDAMSNPAFVQVMSNPALLDLLANPGFVNMLAGKPEEVSARIAAIETMAKAGPAVADMAPAMAAMQQQNQQAAATTSKKR